MKKYKLTDETMECCGRTLHRIEAVKSFGDVKEGDIGGWVEDERNLSHSGNCWVFDKGMVFGNGMVFDNGRVFGNGMVFDNGMVFGNGMVFDNGRVFDKGRVFGNGMVSGNGWVSGNGMVCNRGRVCGDNDILTVNNIGSRFDTTTFFKTDDGAIGVTCGCFHGTIDEFAEAVKEMHGENKFAKEYMLAIELAKLHILGE